MAEHDQPQSDDIRRRLDGLASGIDVGDFDQARSNVDGVVGRRRTRKRVGAVLGAAAVVALAATTVVLTLGGGEPDTLVSTDDTMAPIDTVPVDSFETPRPTLDLPIATAQSVELIDGAGRSVSASGANGAPEYGEWIVPWDDGFLVGSTMSPPQPLPDELPEEVVALFPQEVVDLFDGNLPDTISEATEQLSAAGLLDVVSEIIQANPAAYDAIYGVPTDDPTLDVRFTTDGTTWEPQEIVLPPGAMYLSSVTAVGDRLAAVYSIMDPFTGAPIDGTVTVAVTTDLTNWTTQDIVTPSPGELPEGIKWSVFAQGLVANDNGWVLSVYDSIDADPFSLLPADVRDVIDAGNGLGMSTDIDGLTVEYDFDDDGNNPAVTRTFTWDELGVTPEAAQLLVDQQYSSTLWAATWDGLPAPSDTPADGGPIVATPAGFIQWTDQTWFSPDGITWTASPLPGDGNGGDAWVTGAFNIEGGSIVMSSTTTGAAVVHRVDERGQNAVLLDLPLPASGSLSATAPFGGSSTSGAVVTVDPAVRPDQQLSVEVDGYHLSTVGQGGTFVVTDVATGEVVVSENLMQRGDDEGSITIDEAGITVTDPVTGEVLVVYSQEVLEASETEYFNNGGGEYSPDFWLVASIDGERFVVDDIADSMEGPTSLATNGPRLLLQTGTDWVVYDLR